MAVSGLHSGAHLPGKEAGAFILKLAASTCRHWAGLVAQRESSLLVSVKMTYQAALQAPLSVSPTSNWTYGGNLLKRDFFLFLVTAVPLYFFVCVFVFVRVCACAYNGKKWGLGTFQLKGFSFILWPTMRCQKKKISKEQISKQTAVISILLCYSGIKREPSLDL